MRTYKILFPIPFVSCKYIEHLVVIMVIILILRIYECVWKIINEKHIKRKKVRLIDFHSNYLLTKRDSNYTASFCFAPQTSTCFWPYRSLLFEIRHFRVFFIGNICTTWIKKLLALGPMTFQTSLKSYLSLNLLQVSFKRMPELELFSSVKLIQKTQELDS